MYIQNGSLRIKAKLRRLMLSVFAVCLLVCAALLSVIAGGGIPDGKSGYAGDTHSGWTKYDDSASLGGYGDGGTEQAAYLIGNATQLKDLASYVNGVAPYSGAHNMSGKYIKLTADISLSGYQSDAGWNPIGNYSTTSIYFAGNFDGGGFTVSDIKIYVYTSGYYYFGLFGYISGGSILNLDVSGSRTSNVNNAYVGGIAGYLDGGSIENCSNYDIYSSPAALGVYCVVGGIAGYQNGGSIENCHSAGTMSLGSIYAGGIAGVSVDGSITGSYNSADILNNIYRTSVYTGGIAGSISGSTISNCYNIGQVQTGFEAIMPNQVGGIAGRASNTNITLSYNMGTIGVRGGYTGGVVGYIDAGCDISSCYNTGMLRIVDDGRSPLSSNIGGIAGYVYNSDISDCYNAGAFEAYQGYMYVPTIGGIAGTINAGNDIVNNYYNNQTFATMGVGNGDQSGCTGRTTTEMTGDDTLTNPEKLSGLGGAFVKRTNDTARGVLYYPELNIFYPSTNPTTEHDSEVSIATGVNVYKIFYFYTGATGGNAVYSDIVIVEQPFSLPQPTRTGYVFSGWYNAISGGTQYTDDNNWTEPNDKTLYAQWTAASSYKVTLNKETGTGGSESVTATYGSAMPTEGVSAPSRAGYIFGGYYSVQNGGGTQYYNAAMGSEHTWDVIGTGTLYAKWTANSYTVTLDPDYAGSSTSEVSATYGSAMPTEVSAPSRAGYTFGGYYSGQNGNGNKYYNADMTSARNWDIADNNTTLHARWTGNSITVSFDTAGGSAVSDITVTYGGTYGALPIVTKTGYTFNGWYIAASSGTQVMTATTVTNANSHTLYAQWTIDTYTINYNLNSGTNASGNPPTYTVTTSTITLADATRTGYTFGGWYTNVGLTTSGNTILIGSTGNKTFWAKWTIDTYTINYTLNGGTNASGNPATYTVTTTITLAPATRAGYEFLGWYTDAGLTISGNTVPIGSTGTKTFYAKWSDPVTYNITYNLNSGTDATDNPTTYKVTTSTITLAPVTRTGYTFGGWYDNNALNGSAVTSIPLGSTGDKIFWAKWMIDTYTINYTLNGGTNASGNPATYTVTTSTITLADATRTGYTFGGWYINGGLTTSGNTVPIDSTGDKTFWAKWTANTYTVRYDKNGGDGNPMSDSRYTYDVSEKLNKSIYNKAGYTFAGWNTRADGEGDDYGDEEWVQNLTAESNGVVTLYAVWATNQYSVIYDKNGGEGDQMPASDHKYGTFQSLSINTYTRTGYTFDGWTTRADGTGRSYADGELVNLASTKPTTTLYVRWKAKTYTVTLDNQNGKPDASTEATYDSAMPTGIVKPARDGYLFGGYYDEISGGNQYYDEKLDSKQKWLIDGEKTLYARWTLITYTVRYEGVSGATYNAKLTAYTVESGDIELAAATRPGYTFEGWYESGITGLTRVTAILKGTVGNRIFSARWRAGQYTVSLDKQNGTGGDDGVSATYNSAMPAATAPVKTGYIFGGYYTGSNGGGTQYYTSTMDSARVWSVAAPGKLYAYWTEIFYQLTFDSRGGSKISVRDVTYGAAIGTLAEPTRKGYEFAGWWSTANGGTQYTPDTIYGATGNTQLYARWIISGSGSGGAAGGSGGSLIGGISDGIIIAAFGGVNLLLLLILLRRNKKEDKPTAVNRKRQGRRSRA